MKPPQHSITQFALSWALPQGTYFCCTRGHAFALVNGVVFDNEGLKQHRGEWITHVVKVIKSEGSTL